MNFTSLPENGRPDGHAFEVIISLTRAQYQLRNHLIRDEFLSGCSSCSGAPSFMVSCFFWECSCLVIATFLEMYQHIFFGLLTTNKKLFVVRDNWSLNSYLDTK